jgi:two-component system response regulator NreC
VLRVFIVDDHEIFRDGLRTVVESRKNATVVAEAATVREALARLPGVEFDLLIVDLTMPGMNGTALIREARRLGLRQRVLVLTLHADADIAADAFAAGADGFALKSDSRAVLLAAIDEVMRGQRFVAESVPRERIDRFLHAMTCSDAAGPFAVLSVREREIADFLMRGYGNVEIARELCISPKTVETHRTHVFSKLRVHSLAELLRFGYRQRPPGAGWPGDRSHGATADPRLRRQG